MAAGRKFLELLISDYVYDQLLWQIGGVVVEYEIDARPPSGCGVAVWRSCGAARRLPWTRPPLRYGVDPGVDA